MKFTLLAFKIKRFFYYNVKQIGLFSGLFFSFIFLPLLYTIDIHFFSQFNIIDAAHYETLKGFNNSLISILISILLTTFSVVFVVMQLASSQFSPRILRYFMTNDLRIQRFIGFYLGALSSIFIIQLLDPFFPHKSQLCLIFSLLISLYCILINFPEIIIHLNDNMNVATITNKIKCEIINEVDNLYKEKWQKGNFLFYKRKAIERKNVVVVYWKNQSGYLTEVNYLKLLSSWNTLSDLHNFSPKVTIFQKPIVGEFIMKDASEMFIIELEDTFSEADKIKLLDFFEGIVAQVFIVHKYRNYKQDVNFGVRKLVDIAIKAISPAVNDPTTCINCIDYIGEVVLKLATRRFPSSQTLILQQNDIYVNEFNFHEFVNFAFDQIFQWGKNDPIVVRRLIQTVYLIIPRIENPYNLKVLIHEIEDMNLLQIYDFKKNEHTHEQINVILKELHRFNKIAKEQIAKLQASGVLSNDCIENCADEVNKLAYQETIDLCQKYFDDYVNRDIIYQ